MALFALIGGSSPQPHLDNKIMLHLLSLVKNKRPKILFCPYAKINQIEKSINKFLKLVSNLDCDVVSLNMKNLKSFSLLLNECDIFYVDGGCCDDLISFFKKNGLDKILKSYVNTNKIFAGSSAGAMLYTNVAMGDKYAYCDNFHTYNYKMVKCLNILNLGICPHYQNEDLVIYNDKLKEYSMDAFGIEEDCMLVINDNKFYVIKEDLTKSVYYFDSTKDYLMIPLYEGVVYEKDCSFRS